MTKQHIIKSAAGFLAVLSLSLTGCSNFLDTNVNPNNSDSVEANLLLPSAQGAIGYVLGNQFQIYGSIWSQYWTQAPTSSQYKIVDQYNVQASSFDRPWQFLLADGMKDLDVVIGQGRRVPKYKQYAAIGLILKAYDFQLVTDAFGDIPVKEAAKGDEGILTPHYDSQKEAYDTIFSLIDQGLAMLDEESEFAPGDEDLIFRGRLVKWRAFANTLKLRAYMRLSEVAPTEAAAGIASLQGAVFLTEDAQINYTKQGGNTNPLYSEMLGLGLTENLVASETNVSQMISLNDPRLTTFYQIAADTDKVVPIPQGSYNTQPEYSVSLPGTAVGAAPRQAASALAPVKFISAAESYFLQAEAVSRGWLTGDAKALYQQGIAASFASYKVDQGSYVTDRVAEFPADKDGQVKAIITQKYFAMCGNQGFEAWSEWRRTGYPDFFVTSQASDLGDGVFPVRMLYPNTELTRNPNFPGAKVITDKVWWDAK
ncbi:SusD/RagB family nutrient-binding outer membrane lipoprotein [Chitinophaga tropicalis]|uniref:SusD/RagB family nutrient-binding outer membrane lipoprotein n=1 Tax=Chitinophaga tropicalis TaxID=2683588 RepID=A0A7K1TXN3_9BACT|nr:SusD/RagB family nutrient-binding outer membrane lipoprotein [Chitinophaga tropicalis]MVT06864.1 SusD/RagB family nutrient-binding outer membrane lipoprotein [Chitinophaga tropicalis]